MLIKSKDKRRARHGAKYISTAMIAPEIPTVTLQDIGGRKNEERGITDGNDCDVAGEHSNSPSFADGCHAYVDIDSVSPPGRRFRKSDY
jgi:hypothetical protein